MLFICVMSTCVKECINIPLTIPSLNFLGISSSDTRRSSIRYEPVQSEHPYNSPSPVYREDHLAMNSERGSRGQVESENETDVTVPLSQTEQFMSPRLRDHSPSSDHRAHYSHRGSSYGSRLNQDRIYNSQQGGSNLVCFKLGLPISRSNNFSCLIFKSLNFCILFNFSYFLIN